MQVEPDLQSGGYVYPAHQSLLWGDAFCFSVSKTGLHICPGVGKCQFSCALQPSGLLVVPKLANVVQICSEMRGRTKCLILPAAASRRSPMLRLAVSGMVDFDPL